MLVARFALTLIRTPWIPLAVLVGPALVAHLAVASLEYDRRAYGVGSAPNSVESADLDGDGLDDLVVTNSRSGTISILFGRADGTMHDAVFHPVGEGPYSSAVGDVDGDGHPDIVVANRSSTSLSLLRGFGDGTFQEGERLGIGSCAFLIDLTDFDADGQLDLVSVHFMSVAVHRGLGEGRFTTIWSNFVIGGHALAVADYDADGQLDVGVSGMFGDDVMFFLGTRDGGFVWGGIYVAYGGGPFSMVARDFDRMGKTDLAIANGYSDHVSVLYAPHDKPFYPEHELFPVGNGPRSIVASDLDGDGTLDLATANLDSDDVSLLLGAGDGTFVTMESVPTGRSPIWIESGDFDGDGHRDLCTADSEANEVSVLINQACPKNDDVPPKVHILEPEAGYVVPLSPMTTPLAFETNDDDGFRGGVVHERVRLEHCVLLDGLTVGDEDGLLSDEELFLDTSALCAAARACGLQVLTNPTLWVEAADCAANVGTDSVSLRGVVGLRPGLCP